MKVKSLALIPLAIVVNGCASNWEPVSMDYVVKDKPSEYRVDVFLTNDTKSRPCLLPEHWPNQAGKVNHSSDSIYLLVDGKRFPMENFNTGYCPGGCALVVRPGETVSSSVAYKDFQLPADLWSAPKKFVLPVVAYRCPRVEGDGLER